MELTVKLSASLRNGRFQERALDLPEGSTLAQLAAGIGIPETAVGIFLVNGRHARPADLLHAGDLVQLMPPIGGG